MSNFKFPKRGAYQNQYLSKLDLVPIDVIILGKRILELTNISYDIEHTLKI